MAARYDDVANAVCDAIGLFGVPLYGMSGTLHEEVSKARGVPFVAEFYADLDYDQNGSLIITREHEAVDPARAAARVVRALKEGKVKSVQGPDVSLRTDIVCVHSDTPGAVNVAKAVRAALGELQAASA
jgi:UPF0271 protein